MPFDVLLVDDHKIMRDGLRAILKQSGEFHVVAEAETGADAIQLARKLKPHLILMDISLPGMSGPEAAGGARMRGATGTFAAPADARDRSKAAAARHRQRGRFPSRRPC